MVAWTAATLASCGPGPPPLVLRSITPELGSQAVATGVLLDGGFYAPVALDLGTGAQRLEDELVASVAGTRLLDVALLDASTLAAVVPAGLPLGLHDVVVEDELGRRAVLPEAYRVLPPDDSGPGVEITQPGDRSHVMAGGAFLVRFVASDRQPGLVTRIGWSISGATAVVGGYELEVPAPVESGHFVVEVPLHPPERMIFVDVMAWDDAPDPNRGGSQIGVVIDSCSEDADCDDGLYCNGVERCEAGWCLEGEPVVCEDPFDCTEDACDDELERCVHLPRHELCDDGLACTGEERCTAERGCVPGVPLCDDGIDCTVDYCDEVTRHCWSEPRDSRCDDGVFCNGEERCDPLLGCLPGPPPCSDGVECTIDVCNEASRSCNHVPDDGACNDGDPCTTTVCDRWGGCAVVDRPEGSPGSASCDNGRDDDCDGLVDLEDPDCRWPLCRLLAVSPGPGGAELVVDLCDAGHATSRMWCVSDRNESVLFEESFEGGLGALVAEGDVELSGEAQVPARPGSAGLRLCAPAGSVETPPIDTTGHDALVLRVALGGGDLGDGEYLELLLSLDGGASFEGLLFVGDGLRRPHETRTLLLPPDAAGLPDLRVRVAASGFEGCGLLDDLALLDAPEPGSSTLLLSEDFELGFGDLLVNDPRGGDVSRVFAGGGQQAHVSAGTGAWIAAAAPGGAIAPGQLLVVETILEAFGLGPDGYGLVQCSFDRGARWLDLLGLGLGHPSTPRRIGAVLETATPVEEVLVRAVSPPTSVAVGGDGLRLDQVALTVVEPTRVDRISELVDQDDGTYRATLSTAAAGTARLRCAHAQGDEVRWTPEVEVVLGP